MSAEVLLRVSIALGARPWIVLALADSLEGAPSADRTAVMATVLRWAESEPENWRVLAALLETAENRPALMQTVHLLLAHPAGETIE